MGATLLVAASWIGCNEIFGIGAPVLEKADGGPGGGSEGGSGAGGDAGGPLEDCLDGVDNDDDGFTDCADPKCQVDYGCAIDPEVGWSGRFYVQVITYNPNGAPPSPCPDGKLPAIYYAAPSEAECTGCNCAWAGAACTAPALQRYQGQCDVPYAQGGPQRSSTADCFSDSVNDVGTFLSVTGGPNVASPGTCTPSGGALVNPDTWGQEVRVCAAPAGAGCSAGKACVKKPPSGFEDAVCITQAGTADCPAGWADTSLQVYASGTDERACSTCTCDTTMVKCDGGQYTVYGSNACNGLPGVPKAVLTSGSGCVNASQLGLQNGFNVSIKPELGTPSGLLCGTSTPSGAVTTAGDTRICCRHTTP